MHSSQRHHAVRRRAPERASRSRPQPSCTSIRARLRPRSPGQALVEFALLLPVFLLLLVAAVDFGRLFFTYIQIHNAAREAANYGIHDPANMVAITGQATGEKNAQAQRGEAAISVTTSCADAGGATIACAAAEGGGGSGSTITVVVRQPFTFLTPVIGSILGSTVQMNASATATVLGYAGSNGGTNPGGCSDPVPDFTVIVTSGRTILADPSSSTPNSGICNISGYNWTWGDGDIDVGSATGTSHTYAADGPYEITLEVTNQAGAVTKTRSIVINTAPPPPTCAKPIANFTWTTTGNGSNKVYTYEDTSTVADPVDCPITDWLWTFTDLGTQSNAQNPAPFGYPSNSNHPVTLQVTNSGGSNSIARNT
jgi:Flp pilus assembly protein TadG